MIASIIVDYCWLLAEDCNLTWCQSCHLSGFPFLCCCCSVASVVSDSVRPHRRQPTRLPGPWDSPGKNTGVGCHFLLQSMKVKSESEVAQLCLTLHNPMDCSLSGSSAHGIFQARVLEWGAIAFPIRGYKGGYLQLCSVLVELITAISLHTDKFHSESLLVSLICS